MQKTKLYRNIQFNPEALSTASAEFTVIVEEGLKERIASIMSVEFDNEDWEHDSEAEFFSDLRKGVNAYSYRKLINPYDYIASYHSRRTRVVVRAPTREKIERVFEVLERHIPFCLLPNDPVPEKISPTIFIGHGRSQLWRDLKDHLQDQHGYRVEAYEIGARAGHTIRDILEDMLGRSSIAFLIMTGEDEIPQGVYRARQNVVHEIGLFQGRIGFPRAIVLLEQDTEEFSNIEGIHQIRFSKGNVRETFGDVLATIRREFGTKSV